MKDLENMTIEELKEERYRILSRVIATLTILDEVREIDRIINEKEAQLLLSQTQS